MTTQHHKRPTTRILIYSQRKAGLAGAECTLAMTNHWAGLYNNCSFLILTDHSQFNSLTLPPHVDYIHIPSDQQGETVMLRQTVLMTTLDHFNPHMLIVHQSPTAVIRSNHHAAIYTRQNHPTIKIMLGLWRDSQPNEFNPNDWLTPNFYQHLQTLYDQIWFYTADALPENKNGHGTHMPSSEQQNGYH